MRCEWQRPEPLSLALVFHFNQHISEHAYLASQVCYRGLLHTLRARPGLKANIHISGTLIHALRWLDPEPLELIRAGLEDGQFELMGSTYAQNLPYASDDRDNARQIDLHRKALAEEFGVQPESFWIAERCWRQTLLPVIAGAGYRTVLIEDHILEASGVESAQVYQTRLDGQILKLVRDDQKLKDWFNFTAWFGKSAGLQSYLRDLAAEGGRYLAYAEDAEAMGLWGYGRGVEPTQTWERLGALLDELQARPDVVTGLLRDAPTPVAERSPIVDGCAGWMDASLAQAGRPYHEDGYSDWFDYLARSPRVEEGRKIYAGVRSRLERRIGEPMVEGERILRQLALHTYLAHQYEFGCIGIGGRRYRGWGGVQAALAIDAAADRARDLEPGVEVADVNEDGLPEVIFCDGRMLMITTPAGGRLLYWFDLGTGRLLVGNPLGVAPGAFLADSLPPPALSHPGLWIPGGDENLNGSIEIQEPPTRLAPFLPDWIWSALEGEANHAGALDLAVRDMREPGERAYLGAQRRGFLDEIRIDGGQILDPGGQCAFSIQEESIRYRRDLAQGIELQKVYRLSPAGVEASYRFTNSGSERRSISLVATSELCLDYDAVLRHGRAALRFKTLGRIPGVWNPLTGETLRMEIDPEPEEVIEREALLALELSMGYQFALESGEARSLVFNLLFEGPE